MPWVTEGAEIYLKKGDPRKSSQDKIPKDRMCAKGRAKQPEAWEGVRTMQGGSGQRSDLLNS